MKYLASLSLACLALVAPLSAQKANTAASPLQRGLDSIQAQNVRSDIFFLADDEMHGRDTPSPEQRIAARFLRARLMRYGFQPGYQDSYLYPYPLEQWQVVVPECNVIVQRGESRFALQLGQDYYLAPSARSERDVQQRAVVYAGDTKDLRDLEADIEGKWVLTSGRRPSGSVQRDLFGRGAVGILVLPEDDAEVSVAEAQGKFFERMKDPRPGKTPEAGQPGLLFLTEQSAGHFKPLIKDAKPGDLIDVTVSERCAIVSDPIMLENVVGIWPGSDPKLRNDVIVLSAHYDHVGMQGGQIHNGADDNGSGSTGMLALVEALANYGPMRRTIMIQWVSGEEKGLWGSKAWTENPWLPEGMQVVCDVNIDMIGRNAPDKLNITPTKDHAEYSWLTKVAEKHCAEEGFPKLGNADDYYHRSDHYNYRKNLNVPVIFLFSDVHEDYHKPTDDPEKIDCDKIARVARLVLRVLDDLQGDELGS